MLAGKTVIKARHIAILVNIVLSCDGRLASDVVTITDAIWNHLTQKGESSGQ